MGDSADANDLPPPPPRPDLEECCGGGCVPCILDYYEEALERWRRQVAEIKARRGMDRAEQRSQNRPADKGC